MNYVTSLCLLTFVSILTAFGHLFTKQTAQKNLTMVKKFQQPRFIFGVGLFLLCPILSSIAAKHVDFTILYGMTALNFIFTFLMSFLFLGEKIDIHKIISICFIVSGLIMIIFPT